MALNTDISPPRLYVWPSNEVLTAYQLSTNSPSAPQPGTIAASGTSVVGSGTAFASTVIPGDTFIAGGCTPAVSCPIVTAVADNTHLTLSAALTASGAWQYSGYFTNPSYSPAPKAKVAYPGGTLTATSNSGSGSVVWALTNLEKKGALYAYDGQTMAALWCSYAASCSTKPSLASFTTAIFALPTVVNGYVYVPTAGITLAASNPSCTAASPCSGVLVYSGH
jgi:hypothetical protein